MSNRFFKVTIPRRKAVTYERLVWAADDAGAIAVVNEGTAWPQSYDESATEVVDGEPVVAEITDPKMLELWKTDDPEYDWEAHAAAKERERETSDDDAPMSEFDDLSENQISLSAQRVADGLPPHGAFRLYHNPHFSHSMSVEEWLIEREFFGRPSGDSIPIAEREAIIAANEVWILAWETEGGDWTVYAATLPRALELAREQAA